MLVPSVAVFEEQGKSVLYVANNGTAERKVVEVGFIESGKTEILSGISADDLIVVKGQRNLREGMRREILEGLEEAVNLTDKGQAGLGLGV